MSTQQPRERLANTPGSSDSPGRELIASSLSLKTELLLVCDAIGWMLFTATFLVAGATRPGYDPWRQAISALSLGPGGWVQQANFIGLGALLAVSAFGWRQALEPGTGSRTYPVLKGITGISLIGAGLFAQDPAPGYPPGAVQTASTLHGDIHQICAFVSVTALALSCFVVARRFALEPNWRGWAAYSAVSGILILVFVSIFGALSAQASGIAGIFERLMAGTASLLSFLVILRLLIFTRSRRP
jgi:Protein of unknown function (DUF998)